MSTLVRGPVSSVFAAKCSVEPPTVLHRPSQLPVVLSDTCLRRPITSPVWEASFEPPVVIPPGALPPETAKFVIQPKQTTRRRQSPQKIRVSREEHLAVMLGVPTAQTRKLLRNKFLHSLPNLEVCMHVQQLQACLNVPFAQAANLVVQYPRLLPLPAHDSASALSVSSLLVQRPQLAHLASHQKHRHGQDAPHSSTSLVQSIADLLHVQLPAAAAMVQKQPAIIQTDAAALSQRLQLLCSLSAESLPAITAIVVDFPDLLLMPATELLENIGKLNRALGVTLPQAAMLCFTCPSLSKVKGKVLESRILQLQQRLGTNRPDTRQLAAGDPSLLLMDSRLLQRRLANLAGLWECDLDTVLKFVKAQPGVLTHKFSTVQLNTHTLLAALKLAAGSMQELLSIRPGLLVLSPGEMKWKCAELRHVLRFCPSWRDEFDAANMHTIASMLMASSECFQRLPFLHITQRSRAVLLREALLVSEQEFLQAYPSFLDWRHPKEERAARRKAVALQ